MPPKKIHWNDEMDEVIRKMTCKSRPSREVADYLNTHFSPVENLFTRNSVIGRANRIGLNFRQKKVIPINRGKVEDKSGNITIQAVKSKQQCKVMTKMETPQAKGGIDFWGLVPTSCRYATGVNLADMKFCGKRKRPDSSYCPECHKLVYTRPKTTWA